MGALPRKYRWLYFIKHKNDMHPPVATTSEAIIGCLVYELSTLRLKSTHWMDF